MLSTLTLSRLASWAGVVALCLALASGATPSPAGARRMSMAIATLAVGLALFALFFGLVAACDRL